MEDDLMEGLSLGDEAPEEENPAPAEDELGSGLSLGDEAPEEDEKPKETPMPDEVPDKYEFVDNEPEYNEAVGKVARELGLSQEKAQKFADAVEEASGEFCVKTVKGWVEQLKKDEEIGGDKFNESVGIARKVFDRYAKNPELRTILSYSGITNHPDFVRMFVRIGKELGVEAKSRGRFPNSRMED